MNYFLLLYVYECKLDGARCSAVPTRHGGTWRHDDDDAVVAGGSLQPGGDMLVYNEDRAVQGYITPLQKGSATVVAEIPGGTVRAY